MINKFCIVIPIYNSEQWVEKCLRSVMDQTYTNWEAIIINDNSSDKTLDKIKEVLSNSNYKKQFKILHRTLNVGALENIVYGINKLCNDNEDIILLLDGDDWLNSNDVLEYLNNVYQDRNIWLTHGQYINEHDKSVGCNFQVKDTVMYRKYPLWGTTHLRTFKYKIWNLIDDKDLRDQNNKYFSMTWDQAIMFPLIEMCGKDRIKFIDKILYVYNNLNPINDFRKNARFQIEVSNYIKSKPQYGQLKDINNLDVNIIIFSKDRPMQLDLLLRSIKRFFVNYQDYKFNILYTSSNIDLEKGYTIVKGKYSEFNYILQKDFKEDVKNLVVSNNAYTMFGVDDDVFIDKFNFNSREVYDFKNSNDILSLSLRLGERINYCYSLNTNVFAPSFNGKRIWDWSKYRGDWNYSNSLDFNLFKTIDIIHLINGYSYFNPNFLEGTLESYKNINKRLMICYQNPKVVGIPVNKVQTTHLNRSGTLSTEELNKKFLDGYIISMNNIIETKNIAPHQEINFEFIKE